MRDMLDLAEAAGALTLARLALKLLPFRWLVRASARLPPIPSGTVCPDPRAAAVGRAVERAARRLPWHSKCLVRALAGRMMLLRRGMSSVLCLGVAKEAGVMRAHAWLLAGGGVVCGGTEASDYTPIGAFPVGEG